MGRHSIPGPDDSFDFADIPDFSDEPFDDIPESDDGTTGEQTDHFGADRAEGRYIDPAQYLRNYSHDDDLADEDESSGAADDYPDEGSQGGRRSRDQWRGYHRNESGRRGVSVGVIAALVAVIVVVSTVILWRFFGNSLSHRSDVAAGRCVTGDLTVAVVADPSISDHMQAFADRFNKSAKPVGDRCVSVRVKPADSDTVVAGFIGDWPPGLGERPALWVPGTSISAARLQAVAGHKTISDSRSLVTSPVLVALRPELKSALQKESWATLPDLQNNPDALPGLGLSGWGSLRLALPISGNGDAAFLAGAAVASASAPHGAPASDGAGPLRALVDAQPKLADNSLAEAMNVLLRQDNPATSPVHAVVTTEQQLFTRGESLSDAADMLGSWLPPGSVPVADYPTVLLSGSWLSGEQVTAASEFARFSHKADQLGELAKAGFRVEGITPPSSDVTSFAALPSTLPVGDDALRATLADVLAAPGGGSAVTVMLDQSMTTDEAGKTRLAHVVAALDHRIAALSSNTAVGLWTFDSTEGRALVASGPLDDQVNGAPRAATLTEALNNLSSISGGAVSFTTLRLVYSQALANYKPGQRNSVLVITTGPHTDRTLDGPGLQDFVRQATDPERPVAVNVIDFGADPDRATWQAVARLSGGSYHNLTNSISPDLATALTTLLA